MNWFYFSLLSIIALAIAELTQQKLLNAKNSIEERTSAVFTFLVQAVFTIPIILFGGFVGSFFDVFKTGNLPWMMLVTFIASIAMIYYLRSFKVKNISISTIFVASSVVVSTSLGIMFFGEGLYPMKVLGLSLVLAAIVGLNFKNVQLEKNHLYGLVAGLLFGVAFVIDKRIVLSVHPIIYIFWAFSFISLFGFLFGPKTVIRAVKRSKLTDYKPIVFSGIGYFLFNLFTFTAYTAGGEVGRVDAINNSQIFLIILFEYFVLKHTDGLIRKLLTAILALAGVLILGYF